MTLTDQIRQAVTDHADAVIPAIESVAPQHSGILPSEMLAYVCLCRARGVRTVVESGRKLGVSTEILSNLDWNVVSTDNDPVREADKRLAGRKNLLLLRGDGKRLVDSFKPTDTPAALLLDGPKGERAYKLAMSVRDRYAVMAIHDAHPGSALLELVGEWYLTSDPWLIERYGYLDVRHLEHIGFPSHAALLSAANTLAIL